MMSPETVELPRRCQRQPLKKLLTGELTSAAAARATRHLDECEACQRRLTELAADARWWLDANRYLDAVDSSADSLIEEFDDYAGPHREAETLEELHSHGLLTPSPEGSTAWRLGRYVVKRVIGSGGTGVVLQGIDAELNRAVAIKVLAPALAMHGAARRRFARESQAAAAVVHECVVAIHHVEAAQRLPYLVMQYIDGASLQDVVVRDGPLETAVALRMTAQVAGALAAAHDQGLVHRDVKPANILVGGGAQRVWITDFGLARAVDDASLTRTGFIAGTPHYMSPEQARGETIGPRSDLFGLGSVLYFMLTGRPPFRAERSLAILHRICHDPHRPLREVNPDVPDTVANFVDQLLEKEPSARFADAAEVRAACLRLLAEKALPGHGGGISLAQPAKRLPLRRKRPRRGGRGWWIAPLVLAMAAIGFAAVQLRQDDRSQRAEAARVRPLREMRTSQESRPRPVAGTHRFRADGTKVYWEQLADSQAPAGSAERQVDAVRRETAVWFGQLNDLLAELDHIEAASRNSAPMEADPTAVDGSFSAELELLNEELLWLEAGR